MLRRTRCAWISEVLGFRVELGNLLRVRIVVGIVSSSSVGQSVGPVKLIEHRLFVSAINAFLALRILEEVLWE